MRGGGGSSFVVFVLFIFLRVSVALTVLALFLRVSVRAPLRFKKDLQNIDIYRGFIREIQSFWDRREALVAVVLTSLVHFLRVFTVVLLLLESHYFSRVHHYFQETLTSLETYIENMKEDQTDIYFIAGGGGGTLCDWKVSFLLSGEDCFL